MRFSNSATKSAAMVSAVYTTCLLLCNTAASAYMVPIMVQSRAGGPFPLHMLTDEEPALNQTTKDQDPVSVMTVVGAATAAKVTASVVSKVWMWELSRATSTQSSAISICALRAANCSNAVSLISSAIRKS